ncbi:hypothetical protein [Streptomyces niveiscabiei]|uniref:hypothetical protein n=1 Tax=Streptomyces niveiscabiei TaxID=164115 RepID=UPI000B267EEA|nr:hypothetical protein [Streptomyces niveiscabiei]
MLIAVPPEREPQQDRNRSCTELGSEKPLSLIDSEIVIVTDEGTEEPFDPVSWFP